MLEIGDNTLVGAYCVVQNNNHGINRGKLIRLQDNVGKPLVIGRDCWLGAHVCVLGGASIGDGAVVGAQSLVNRPVEPFTVVGGVPARVLKLRG
ncbi:acyltransferase [Alicyclobacillus hesperidum]